MVTNTTAIGLNPDIANAQACDEELHHIIDEINHYLYNFGHSWIFLSIGRSHFQKCSRSWARVYVHLGKFLQDPRSNYSLLMTILDHEKQKFPQGSFYAKKLIKLEQLVCLGPIFQTLTYIRNISPLLSIQ
ncbi:MAG: hypothetical protein AB7V32_07455 [Candidatus Berkiella sp.]